MHTHTKKGLLLCSLLAGCTSNDIRPPSAEERALIERNLMIIDAGMPTVEALVEATDRDFYDFSGNVISKEQFIKNLHRQQEELELYYENERIFIFTEQPKNFNVEVEAAAFHHEDSFSEKRDYIALQEGYNWGTEVFTHEIGHEFGTLDKDLPGGHQSEFFNDEGSHAYDIELAWKYKDTPFINTALFGIVDRITQNSHSDLMMDHYVDSFRDGDTTYQEVLESYDLKYNFNFEEWSLQYSAEIHHSTDQYGYNDGFSDFLGITREELEGAMKAGGLYEVYMEDYRYWRRELMREMQAFNEAKVERQREFSPGARR